MSSSNQEHIGEQVLAKSGKKFVPGHLLKEVKEEFRSTLQSNEVSTLI